jgi:phosphoglucosamine mutase
MYEAALCAGITAAGADAYTLHVTTTPSVSYVARTDDFDCGIMISASHNPFGDNGIKLINRNGEKMEEEVLDAVEAYLDGLSGEIPLATGGDVGRIVDYAAGRNRYIGYLISLATQSYRGVKVGLDCANGSTWQIAKNVFDALGADTYVIHDSPDGLNINRGCGSTHMDCLRDYVKAEGLDVGFAFDGDADRCLAVDENGRIVDGDAIMYLCARYMKEEGLLGDTKVVTTVMSNYGLYKALDAAGIAYEKTDVGDEYVYENMASNGYLIGGEQSGHIIFRKYATTGDGLITAIMIMQVMLEKKMALSALAAPVTVYPQVLKNVVVTDKDGALCDEGVRRAVDAVAKTLNGTGRVLLRKSGTEPVLRVMAEAPTQEICNDSVDSIIAAMRERGLLVKVK